MFARCLVRWPVSRVDLLDALGADVDLDVGRVAPNSSTKAAKVTHNGILDLIFI